MFTMVVLTLLSFSAQIKTIEILEDIQWIVYNQNGSIKVPAEVPGGIYSDLQKAKVIDDILYRMNDVTTRWVARDNWTYEGSFNVNEYQLQCDVANVIFHGVDTVAFVELNDVPIGITNNMFVRHVFNVKAHLKEGKNQLKIIFSSPIEVADRRSSKYFTEPNSLPSIYNGENHVNQLRKMQASFAWDWGPAFPSVGFWKPVTLEFYDRAIIRSVTTHIQKNDDSWHLRLKVYLESSAKYKVWKGILMSELNVEANQKISKTKGIEVPISNDGNTEADIDMVINENLVRTWWPNGFGDQPLYKLRVTIYPFTSVVSDHHKNLEIGFRTLELVQQNASTIFGNKTAGQGLTFYFKVNGYPIFMKGSNWIPAHILPEFGAQKDIVDHLLLSAREAHMNMLRVWGGGVYESDYFYQRCDQLGILIWQDFMFACSMYPADPEFLDSVRTEIEQNVIRLQHHTSIALWAGNNENEVALRGNWYNTASEFDKYKQEYIKLYVDTIKPIVNGIDPHRTYVVSSPSNGLKSEEDGYIADNPYDAHYGDTHYYNYYDNNWDQNTYPKTRFASEYGFQSLPSIATMKTATNNSQDFNVDSSYSNHRQHCPSGYNFIKNQIELHLQLNTSSEISLGYHSMSAVLSRHAEIILSEQKDYKYFEKFVFYSQITQAMAMKAETEYYRQSQADWYNMGALYWQLNDVWQAPSWSGIEYGGRWKMLHYYAKSFFAPVLVSPRLLNSGDVDVYLLNDRFVPIIEGQITIDVYNWSSLIPIKSQTYPANAEPLSSKKQDFAVELWDLQDKRDIFLRFALKAEGVPSSPYNFVFPVPLKDIRGLREPHIRISGPHDRTCSRNEFRYKIDIRVDTVVLFLWLETNIEGHFEDNGFIMTQPYLTVQYISKNHISTRDLRKAISYKYMSPTF